MTPKQERSFARYVGEIARTLAPGWDIRLHFADPGDPGGVGVSAAASVGTTWGRRLAHLTVDPDVVTWTPEEQRHVIVHEFIHIPFMAVTDLVDVSFREKVGSLAWEAFKSGWVHADEHATDALAKAIAPFFPLWEGA